MVKHLEFIVEDSSGKMALEILLPKILAPDVTYNIHSYKGIGRIPRGMSPATDPNRRILLDQLPRIIKGFGRAFLDDPADYIRKIVIVCDLDDHNQTDFEMEIQSLVESCNPKPPTILCLAIEEGEAWLLGDLDAVIAAYPRAIRNELTRYVPDSICGTWELLADVIEKGGAKALKAAGHQEIGKAKHRWAVNIGPQIDLVRNRSPSFRQFVEKTQGA